MHRRTSLFIEAKFTNESQKKGIEEMTETKQIGQDISNKDYHMMPGISNSQLKVFLEDPRVYHHRFVLGNYIEERKSHFDFGSAVHELSLTGEAPSVAVIPGEVLSRTGTRAGNIWKAWMEAHDGKLMVTQDEWNRVEDCANAIERHPIAGALVNTAGPVEQSFFSDDTDLELSLRCRPDKLILTNDGATVIDLKTTSGSTTASQFVRAIANYGYHYQEHFYRRVLRMNGLDVRRFIFIAVAVNPPHTVDCYELDEEFQKLAAINVENGLMDLAERIRSKDWQARSANGVVQLAPPNWLKYSGDYSL